VLGPGGPPVIPAKGSPKPAPCAASSAKPSKPTGPAKPGKPLSPAHFCLYFSKALSKVSAVSARVATVARQGRGSRAPRVRGGTTGRPQCRSLRSMTAAGTGRQPRVVPAAETSWPVRVNFMTIRGPPVTAEDTASHRPVACGRPGSGRPMISSMATTRTGKQHRPAISDRIRSPHRGSAPSRRDHSR
jgi:hypothetical protein